MRQIYCGFLEVTADVHLGNVVDASAYARRDLRPPIWDVRLREEVRIADLAAHRAMLDRAIGVVDMWTSYSDS
jgi:hypothetical protein